MRFAFAWTPEGVCGLWWHDWRQPTLMHRVFDEVRISVRNFGIDGLVYVMEIAQKLVQ